jgi:hypothetical protein
MDTTTFHYLTPLRDVLGFLWYMASGRLGR